MAEAKKSKANGATEEEINQTLYKKITKKIMTKPAVKKKRAPKKPTVIKKITMKYPVLEEEQK
ncbi:hypothetical protein QBC43DRAFT_292661 [Cladorrhinum sp. PSN259]|nr:hypothetical protein QBC43DRAFT_292661 [Cladorrhinum sp. PSN259]